MKASVALGDRRPEITSSLDFRKGLKGVFDVAAPSVHVDALDPSLAGVVDGRICLSAHGNVNGGDISLNGKLTSPLLTAAQTPVSNLSIPFSFRQNKVAVPGGQFEVGGGAFHLKANGDLSKGVYEVQLDGRTLT